MTVSDCADILNYTVEIWLRLLLVSQIDWLYGDSAGGVGLTDKCDSNCVVGLNDNGNFDLGVSGTNNSDYDSGVGIPDEGT